MTHENTAPESLWLIPDTLEGFDLDGAIDAALAEQGEA
jgi:hypothetical protein